MGKLLLRADGILAQVWNPLDPPPPYEAPDHWDGPHVSHGFSEAVSTLLKLPIGDFGPRKIRNCWPAYQSEWADLLSMVGDGADGLEQSWARRNQVHLPPTAREVSHMEQALPWPGRYLRGAFDLVYALNATALTRACELELADVVRRGPRAGVCSTIVWQQLALEAADRIASGLVRDRVAVF
jgi:hypothetical protein